MECTPECGPSQSERSYTDKQRKLISECDLVISREGIRLEISGFVPSWDGLIVSCDVEHDEEGNLVGIGVCHDTSCYYFTTISDSLVRWVLRLQIVAHNGVSDFENLRMWGVNVRDEQLVWDTMLMGHLLDSSLKSYGLKDMAKRELGIEYPSYDDIVGKRGLKAERVLLDRQPLELVSKYNACDTLVTWKLYEKQKKAMGI